MCARLLSVSGVVGNQVTRLMQRARRKPREGAKKTEGWGGYEKEGKGGR